MNKIISILFSVLVLFLFIGCTKSRSLNDSYWDNMALQSYIIDTKTDMRQGAAGNGHLQYNLENSSKEFAIVCYQYTEGSTAYSCCKEGEIVPDSIRLGWENIQWLNVTFEANCYSEQIAINNYKR